MRKEAMIEQGKPPECKTNEREWDRYCINMSKPSHKDWCRICGREVGDHEYMRYGFADSRCKECR